MHALSIPCVAMAVVNFYVGTYHLYFFAKRPQIREHLPFALLCVAVGLYDLVAAGLYNSTTLADGVFWQRLQLNAVGVISVFLVWFTGVFTEGKVSRIVGIGMIWFVVLLVASVFAPPALTLTPENPAVKAIRAFNFEITYYEAEVGLLYQVELLSAVAAYAFLCYRFIRHYRKTRQRILLLIVICQFLYFGAVVNDSLVAIGLYTFVYVSEYAFFFIVVAMAYTLLDRFVNLHAAFEELNANLEAKVDERTREIHELNEHLKKLADRDGLTGVYNRRFFNHYFEIEVKRAKSYQEHKAKLVQPNDSDMNFGLAIIDIDHFKQINDTHGHPMGDRLLKQVIDIVERSTFTRDVLCRYGGDEFALLLTKTSNSGIRQAMEKIRKEIDEHPFTFGELIPNQHITISAGLVTFDEVLDKGSDEILQLADDRLLEAKGRGRNRVVAKEDM
jgi:diguanylate cyclase (GGDEF)-like protein